MARIITIANQKGGVGKTATAVNLGAYLAAHGKRTLLIDFDPQAHATLGLGFDFENVPLSIYNVIAGEAEPAAAVKKTTVFGFDVLPATPALAGAAIELVGVKNREFLLEEAIKKLRSHYDFILIDSPPTLGLLTVNGIVAAKELIIPVQCEFLALNGLTQLLSTIELVSANLDRTPERVAALLTMYDRRNRLNREIVKRIRREFPGHVFDAVIPRNVSLAEAPEKGRPILHFAPESQGAKAYRQLAQELINLPLV